VGCGPLFLFLFEKKMCKENTVNSEGNEDLKYKTYLEERNLLVSAEIEGSRLFDKAILTLAAGSFGLSIAFIKQIFTSSISNYWILALAWICFGMSILSTLISLLTSQHGCSKQRDILEMAFFDNHEEIIINKPAIWTKRLNWFSIVSFIIGVGFLGMFVISNLAIR
jgi:hypothetical protein